METNKLLNERVCNAIFIDAIKEPTIERVFQL